MDPFPQSTLIFDPRSQGLKIKKFVNDFLKEQIDSDQITQAREEYQLEIDSLIKENEQTKNDLSLLKDKIRKEKQEKEAKKKEWTKKRLSTPHLVNINEGFTSLKFSRPQS